MKTFKYLSFIIITLFATNVYAASASLSASTGSVYIGDTFTVNVRVNSAAAWEIHVSSSGPVSGCTISEADSTSNALNTSRTFSASCKSTAEGNITINLSGNVTDQDGNTSDVTGTNVVRVMKRPVAPSTNTGTNTNTSTSTRPSANTSSYTNSYSQRTNTTTNTNIPNIANVESTEQKSTNNNLKSISVDNYKIEKIDNNNYKLTVNNNIDSIVIKAEVEDTKAKLEGAGKKDIKIGENNIQIKVTAESGTENIYNLKVIRKDAFYITDLKALLEDNAISIKNVIISSDTKLTKDDLNLIRESGSTVYLNYLDKEKNNIYTWIIDGSLLKFSGDFLTTVTFGNSTNKDLLKASNYASGININFNKTVPTGVIFRLNAKNAYEKSDKPNLYFYNTNLKKLELISKEIDLKDKVIDVENPKAGDYLITLSNIAENTIKEVKTVNYYLISTIGLFIILALFVIFHFIRVSKEERKIKELTEELKEENEESFEEVVPLSEEAPVALASNDNFNDVLEENNIENTSQTEEAEEKTAIEPSLEEGTNLLNSDVVKPVDEVEIFDNK